MSGAADTMTRTPEGIRRLFAQLDRAHQRFGRRPGLHLAEALRPVLAAALADPQLLPERVAAHRPASGFGRHLLRADRNLTVLATVTSPDSALPPHDHACWGLTGLYRGVQEETRYEPTSQLLPGEPMLMEIERVLRRPGDVHLVQPPPLDIHALANVGTEWTVSVHVLVNTQYRGYNVYLPPRFEAQATCPLPFDSSPEGS